MTFADDSNLVNSLHHIPEGLGQNPKVVQSQPQIHLSHPTNPQPQTHTAPTQRLVLAPASTQHAQAQIWRQSARQLQPQRPLQPSPMQNLHPSNDTLSIERQSISPKQSSHSQQHLNFREIMDPYFHPNPNPNPRPLLKTSPANLFQRENMTQNGSAYTGNEHFNEYNSRRNMKTVSVTDDAVKVTSKGNEF